MIRNLKVLFLAAMALTAFGAVNAVGAHAAEETFHCASAPCRLRLRTDGTSTTAHHVFVVKNSTGESISFTCESLTGDATLETKTTENITLTGVAYDNCKSVLGAATVDMNGCTFVFNSRGGGTDAATVTVECKVNTERIVITNQTCTVEVGPQGPLKGIGYHNIHEAGKEEEVTVTAKVPGIAVAVKAGSECGIDLTKTPLTSEYTTGNTIVSADTDPAEAPQRGWWE